MRRTPHGGAARVSVTWLPWEATWRRRRRRSARRSRSAPMERRFIMSRPARGRRCCCCTAAQSRRTRSGTATPSPMSRTWACSPSASASSRPTRAARAARGTTAAPSRSTSSPTTCSRSPTRSTLRISAPTLILTGDRDHFCSTEEAVTAFRRLPRGELAVLPAVGHFITPLAIDLATDFIRRHVEDPIN